MLQVRQRHFLPYFDTCNGNLGLPATAEGLGNAEWRLTNDGEDNNFSVEVVDILICQCILICRLVADQASTELGGGLPTAAKKSLRIKKPLQL